jgi:hypothetical protein
VGYGIFILGPAVNRTINLEEFLIERKFRTVLFYCIHQLGSCNVFNIIFIKKETSLSASFMTFQYNSRQ